MSSPSEPSEIEAKADRGREIDVSIILPTFRYTKIVGDVIDSISAAVSDESFKSEIIVSGHFDDSIANAAKKEGIRVVSGDQGGYSNDVRYAMQRACGETIVFIDPFPQYDFNRLPELIKTSIYGEDDHLIIGKRVSGYDSGTVIHDHALSRALLYVLSTFHGIDVDDQNGPYVASKSLLHKLNLSTEGMELRSEILVSVSELGIPIEQVPIVFNQSERAAEATGATSVSTLRQVLSYVVFSDPFLLVISLLGTIAGLTGLLTNNVVLSSTMVVWVLLALAIFIRRFSRTLRGVASGI